MKKFIQWLAKKFNANISTVITETVVKEVEKVVEKEVIKEVPVFDGEVVRGNLTVEGNLVVEGYLEVYGTVTAKEGMGAYGVKAKIECLKK